MLHNVASYVFPATFALLPGAMDTPEARALLLAIGLQESRFEFRKQVGGPAHGFWQFEKGGGVHGVLVGDATARHVIHVCEELCYLPTEARCYEAIEHNDVLACALARLLLWTLPGLLADRGSPDKGWMQYLAAWRPGKPGPDRWAENWQQAGALITA